MQHGSQTSRQWQRQTRKAGAANPVDEAGSQQATEDSDRPLDFHWRVPKEAAARAGWSPSGDEQYDRAARSVMAALVLASRAGQAWV